jgi:hypothetical protein
VNSFGRIEAERLALAFFLVGILRIFLRFSRTIVDVAVADGWAIVPE